MNNSPTEDTLNWEAEAEAIIQDVANHVNHISVSKKLKNNAFEIFLNLKTLEDKDFCIRASGNGFSIVAEEFDKIMENQVTDDDGEVEIFETPYALLNKISPSYVQSFGNQLSKQLQNLDESSNDE